LLNQSLKLFELMSDEMGMSHALIALGDIAMEQRDPMRAGPLYEQSLRLSQHCGEKGTEIYALRGLGWVARYQAAYRQSAAWYHESLALCRELREQRGIVIGLEGLASVGSGQGQAEQAIALFAAAAALRDRIAYPLLPAYRADYQGMLELARARLDDATFATAWRTGLMLTPDQALALTQDIRATS
jgi:tetratricopeptide (TPR) repeat protein